jgi:hypothetical protein
LNDDAPRSDTPPPVGDTRKVGFDPPIDQSSPTQRPRDAFPSELELTAVTRKHLADAAKAASRAATAPIVKLQQERHEQFRRAAAGWSVGLKADLGSRVAWRVSNGVAEAMASKTSTAVAGLGRDLAAGCLTGLSQIMAKDAVGWSTKISADLGGQFAPVVSKQMIDAMVNKGLAVGRDGNLGPLAAGRLSGLDRVLRKSSFGSPTKFQAKLGSCVAWEASQVLAGKTSAMAATLGRDLTASSMVRLSQLAKDAAWPATFRADLDGQFALMAGKLAAAARPLPVSMPSSIEEASSKRVVDLVRVKAERETAAYRADAAVPELLNLTERQAEILVQMNAAIDELTRLTRTAQAHQQAEGVFNRRIQWAVLLATLAALALGALGYFAPRQPTRAEPELQAPSGSVTVPHGDPTEGDPGARSRHGRGTGRP